MFRVHAAIYCLGGDGSRPKASRTGPVLVHGMIWIHKLMEVAEVQYWYTGMHAI